MKHVLYIPREIDPTFQIMLRNGVLAKYIFLISSRNEDLVMYTIVFKWLIQKWEGKGDIGTIIQYRSS